MTKNSKDKMARQFSENDEPLRQIVQGNPIPTFVLDNIHTVTHWNKACENLTGISAKEIVGTSNQWQAFYASERPVMADFIVDNKTEEEIGGYYGQKYKKSFVMEGAYEAENFFPDLGEDGKWLFFTAAPLRNSAGEVIGAIETIQDITERKNIEHHLRESENQYKALTESVADGVALFQDGRLVLANHAFSTMFGTTGAEPLVGKAAVDFVSEDFKKPFNDQLLDLQQGILSEHVFEATSKTIGGREFWGEFHLSLIQWKGVPAILSTLRDITERKTQQLAMKRETEMLRKENLRLKSDEKNRYRFGDIIGKSVAMQKVYERISVAANTEANIVIHGESGTGKELVSKAIHQMSERKHKRFVPVNCGAIPENLIESEFFGYKKGAFTGANTDKVGCLDMADQGTLFLDEVGEIGLNMQVKLLRAIEKGGFTPIGSSEVKKPDIRIIAATNRNLADMVNRGQMRKDFYYRINIIPVELPPLRERKEDLPLLIDHFLKKFGGDKKDLAFPGEIIGAFMRYDWPGNVRELQNLLQRYISLKDTDFLKELPSLIPLNSDDFIGEDILKQGRNLPEAVALLEKRMIVEALNKNLWHRGKAASDLDVDRKTLYSKIKKYGLERP